MTVVIKKHRRSRMRFFNMYFAIISKLILLIPHSVVAHRSYKSSSIKPVRVSVGWTSVKGVGEIRFYPGPKPNQQQMPMRHCSRLSL